MNVEIKEHPEEDGSENNVSHEVVGRRQVNLDPSLSQRILSSHHPSKSLSLISSLGH